MSCVYDKSTAAAVAPPRAALLLAVNNLPAGLQLLSQLPHLLASPDTTLEEIVTMMRRDAALTARMIRIANSVVYAPGGQPFYSIEDAVLRLGFSEVYRITGYALLAQLSNQQIPLYDITGVKFRESSLLTALIAETLAPMIGVDPRAAYTAGLLRSTGKIALDRAVRAANGGEALAYTHGPLADWETQHVGCTSASAGATVLEAWGFPAVIVEAVRDHWTCGSDASPLTRLLHIAAGAAERCGHGLPGEYAYWEQDANAGAIAGISESQLNDAICGAIETFGPVRPALA